MRGCVIYNPAAGSAERVADLHKELVGFEFLETRQPDDAKTIAANARQNGFDLVVAAGGDGTINQVVNGLMSRRSRPALGVIPMGTGNDLARTLGIPIEDPAGAVKAILQNQVRPIDVIKMKMGNAKPRWCINVAAGGFTGQMNEAMTDELKASWGPLAYIRGAIKVLPDLTGYRTAIRYDMERGQKICALNVIVANGRTAGGGTEVAPLANPEDGLLDVVIVHHGGKLQLSGVAARLIAGNYLNSDLVTHRRVKRFAIRSTPGMWFNIDGELIGNDPVVFQVHPQALNVVVGPDYHAARDQKVAVTKAT